AAQASLRTGIPAPTLPDVSSGVLKPSTTASPSTYTPFIGTVTFPKDWNRGYIESWNFFIERQFNSTTDAEVGYVGTHSVHQQMYVNINAAAPGTGNPGRQLAPYLLTDLNSVMPFGNATYNGLQTRLKKRIGGSTIGVSYTFAKALNNIAAQGTNGDN